MSHIETGRTVLAAENLTKYYGKARGIQDINLEIQAGEIFGFIGPNGAGKSTTIRTLLGLLFPTSGSGKILGMELFKTPESLVTFVTEKTGKEMAAAFRQKPERFRTVFGLTEQDYLRYTFAGVREEMRAHPEKSAEYEFDPAVIETLLTEIGSDPDKFMEKLKAAPDEYRKLLNLPGISDEEFLQGIARSEAELADFKEILHSDPAMYVDMFEADPVHFLVPYKTDRAGFSSLLADFGLPSSLERRIFLYYPLSNYLVHCLYIFLLMLCLGSLGLALSVFVKGNRSVSGASVGITLGLYFINSISNISPVTDAFGYISPFKFVNNDILNPAYGPELWRIAYFAGVTLILLTAGLLVFRRKDVLV